MLAVGPSQQCTDLAIHSCPIRTPACSRSSQSQVAASPVPQGRDAAGTPLKNLSPRMPLGPSLSRISGTSNRGSGCVAQNLPPAHKVNLESPDRLLLSGENNKNKARGSIPARRETFSERVALFNTCSMSNGSVMILRLQDNV